MIRVHFQAHTWGVAIILRTDGKDDRTMDQGDILRKIQDSLHERFGLELSRLDESARLRDIGVDSLHVVEIMLDLEAELGTNLVDLSFPPNPSLGEVASVISKNIGGPA